MPIPGHHAIPADVSAMLVIICMTKH